MGRVKSGVNGLLDVARQTYKESTGDVHQLVEDLSREHDRPLELKFEGGRGYYLRLPAFELEDRPLPPVFVNVVKKKKFVEFTTLELVKRNAKVGAWELRCLRSPTADEYSIDGRFVNGSHAHEYGCPSIPETNC